MARQAGIASSLLAMAALVGGGIVVSQDTFGARTAVTDRITERFQDSVEDNVERTQQRLEKARLERERQRAASATATPRPTRPPR